MILCQTHKIHTSKCSDVRNAFVVLVAVQGREILHVAQPQAIPLHVPIFGAAHRPRCDLRVHFIRRLPREIEPAKIVRAEQLTRSIAPAIAMAVDDRTFTIVRSKHLAKELHSSH